MKFKINYNGKYEDSIIIEADTIEEIKNITHEETKKRNWDENHCWSERL